MNRTTLLPLLLAAALAAGASPAAERSQVDPKYTWNLSDLYPSEEAFVRAREKVEGLVPALKRFDGHLGDSPAALLEALTAVLEVDKEIDRLRVYSNGLKDQDLRVGSNLERSQSVERLQNQFRTATSFLRPGILSLGGERVEKLLAGDARLGVYRHYIDEILRRAPHTLPAGEERLLARAEDIAGAGASIFSIFSNAEIPSPEVALSTGEKVALDSQNYTTRRTMPNRDDRLKVFHAYWGTTAQFRRTLAATMYATVKAHLFARDARKFDSCLEAALFDDDVPPAVYRQLLADVHANLSTLHRYLKLRQRILGLGELGYEDLYAPLVKEAELTYTPEQATDLVLASFAPLGADYVGILRRGFESRWVDFLPSTGKRSGAYSTGAYDVHPYQLLNYMGQYDDVSTLAHESGHSMHTWLSFRGQPYVYSEYSLFVAEVASTLNEHLLLHHMLEKSRDDGTRLYLLGSALENYRTTVFRQAMFAEFELKMHEMVERGETLSAENLNKLYLSIVREYYGHDKGVCKVDELYGGEWARVPHFYRGFYVYQYATSFVASAAIGRAILDEAGRAATATPVRDAYLGMLGAGGSKGPIELLKDAGVDMTTPRPFRAAMQEINAIMDEMEAILARKAR